MKRFASLFLVTLLTMIFCNVKAQSTFLEDQTIFFEDFNNDPTNSALPEGWTVYGDNLPNVYGGYNQSWQVWYPDGTIESGEAMSITYTTDTWGTCNRWLITPRITLPADSVMSLLFRHRCSVHGQFSVRISTKGTDTADFTTEIGWITAQQEKNYESISLEDFAGESVYIAFVNNIYNGFCAQFIALDDIEVTHLPENSVALTDVVLPEQAVVGQSVTAKLKLFNTGRNNLQSITYSYSVNGGNPVVRTANVRYRGWGIYEVDFSIIPTEVGESTMEFKISLPNGVADYDSTDNVIARTLRVISEPSVGITTAEQDVQVMVFPNPFRQKVTIQVESGELKAESGVVTAWLTDLSGRREEVRLIPDGPGQYTLDLTSRPQATYLLTLTTGDGRQHTVRLMKQSDVFGQ